MESASTPKDSSEGNAEPQSPHESVISAIIDLAAEAGAEVIKLGEGQSAPVTAEDA